MIYNTSDFSCNADCYRMDFEKTLSFCEKGGEMVEGMYYILAEENIIVGVRAFGVGNPVNLSKIVIT